MNVALEGATYIAGSLFILFTSVIGTLRLTLCVWVGARVFIDKFKLVESAEQIVHDDIKRMELERMASTGMESMTGAN